MTDMRFGFFLPQGWRLDMIGVDPADQWPTIKALAERADAGPWDSVWVYDHVHTTPISTDEPTFEAWSMMAALAASTSRVRLGQMCTCVLFRNPAHLAKMAATIDHVSGGRLEMGIGAGWYEEEARAYGYEFPRAGVRLAMLDEAAEIMRRLWADGVASFDGEHYRLDHAVCQPRPLQPGGIPLWIAGGGEQVTLRIAAKHGRFSNFDGTPDGFARKSAMLAEHCREVGTDFDAITRTSTFHVLIGETEAEVADRRAWLREHWSAKLTDELIDGEIASFDNRPAAVGTVEQVVDKFRELRGLGMTYPIFFVPDAAYTTRSLELLELVIAELRRD